MCDGISASCILHTHANVPNMENGIYNQQQKLNTENHYTAMCGPSLGVTKTTACSLVYSLLYDHPY